jgi:hypothetical protein
MIQDIIPEKNTLGRRECIGRHVKKGKILERLEEIL